MSFDKVTQGLVQAASSDFIVQANLARIWENVFDWEHLPHLHAETFARVALIEARDDGFDLAMWSTASPTREDRIHLKAERERLRYWNVTTTQGRPLSEVQVVLEPLEATRTRVKIAYHVRAERKGLGPVFAKAYEKLWDEDEAMMMARQAHLDQRATAAVPVALGPRADLNLSLPREVNLGGRTYRLSAGPRR